MATIGTRLFTMMYGELVGTDQYGNKYYRTKGGNKHKRIGVLAGKERRWVIFKGADEASKVPPEWHAWLHRTVDEPLTRDESKPWTAEHSPNLTGTAGAYFPPGHDKRGGVRDAATGDYEPWTPNA